MLPTKKYLYFFFSILLALIILHFTNLFIQKQDFCGSWQGVLNLNGIDLPIVLKTKKTDKNELLINIDIPEQGLYGLRTDSVIVTDSVKFTIPAFNSRFSGTFDKSKTILTGLWKPSCCNGITIDFVKVK